MSRGKEGKVLLLAEIAIGWLFKLLDFILPQNRKKFWVCSILVGVHPEPLGRVNKQTSTQTPTQICAFATAQNYDINEVCNMAEVVTKESICGAHCVYLCTCASLQGLTALTSC